MQLRYIEEGVEKLVSQVKFDDCFVSLGFLGAAFLVTGALQFSLNLGSFEE